MPKILEHGQRHDIYTPDLVHWSTGEWDLDSARIRLGVDLIAVYGLNLVAGGVWSVNVTRSDYLAAEEMEKIKAASEALAELTFSDWNQNLGILPLLRGGNLSYI